MEGDYRGETDFNVKVTYHIFNMCWSFPTTGDLSSLVFLLVPTPPHMVFFKPCLQTPKISLLSPIPEPLEHSHELPSQPHNFSPFILQPVQLLFHPSRTPAGRQELSNPQRAITYVSISKRAVNPKVKEATTI